MLYQCLKKKFLIALGILIFISIAETFFNMVYAWELKITAIGQEITGIGAKNSSEVYIGLKGQEYHAPVIPPASWEKRLWRS